MLPQPTDVRNNSDYSTKQITPKLLSDIEALLKDLDYGSVELYVTDSEVTQITKRQIRKTRSTPARGN